MRMLDRPAVRATYLLLVLVALMAGDALRYSLGWIGYLTVVGLLAVASALILVAQRERWRLGRLPLTLAVFVMLTVVSLTWSAYPAFTALGALATGSTILGATAVAVTYSWVEILRGLGIALRLVLGLSVVFEVIVATVIRQPVLPIVPEPGIDYETLPDPIPLGLYWSRDQLFDVFDGGRIQGIVGNAVLLSFLALIGLIVFTLQLANGSVRRRWSVVWLAIAAVDFAFSRSATNIVGLVVVIIVVAAVLIVRRASTTRALAVTYGALLGVAAAGTLIATRLSDQLLSALGKSPDLTNRTDIWNAVIGLAQQRPTAGWGWISYWAPWVAPFDTLAKNNGIRQLHAHNAWLDVWFQLGVIGLVVFGALVLTTLRRSWVFAVDRPRLRNGRITEYSALSLLPLLLLVALLVQSVAESRLLVEFGLFALSLIAVKTKLGAKEPSPALDRREKVGADGR